MGDERVDRLEAAVQAIELRNSRVQADKAWETSLFRRLTIAAMTYIVVLLFLVAIRVATPWLHALVPTAGYVLSTLSLPWIKHWWCAQRYAD